MRITRFDFGNHEEDPYNRYDQWNDREGGPPQGDGDPEFTERRERSRRTMQGAARVLAVLSVLSCFMIYISLPLGGLSIILAFLSRQPGQTPGRSRTTVSLAAAGMLSSVAVTGFAFYRVSTDPVLRTQMQQLADYYTGLYLGESASEAFPWLFTPGGETSTEEDVTWSDEMLNDHDKLVDYFTTPHGSPKNSEDPPRIQTDPLPVITSPEGEFSGGSFT